MFFDSEFLLRWHETQRRAELSRLALEFNERMEQARIKCEQEIEAACDNQRRYNAVMIERQKDIINAVGRSAEFLR